MGSPLICLIGFYDNIKLNWSSTVNKKMGSPLICLIGFYDNIKLN